MLRGLFTPRWLLVHALFIVATIATGLLAVWQWSRAHDAGGSFQNLGYALQWPLFGAFTLFFWWRVIRLFGFEGADEQSPAVSAEAAREATDTSAASPARTRRRPLVPPPAASVDSSEDPDLAAYNRLLAELHEADRPDAQR